MTQDQIAKTVWLHLSPDNAAGLSLSELQRFAIGQLHLPEAVLMKLAQTMKVKLS